MWSRDILSIPFGSESSPHELSAKLIEKYYRPKEIRARQIMVTLRFGHPYRARYQSSSCRPLEIRSTGSSGLVVEDDHTDLAVDLCC